MERLEEGPIVLARWIVFAALAVTASIAAAQGYPDRPIRIVVPLPPGGSPDTIARVLSQGLQAVWSQPLVVENRTGGSQNIGADVVAKSPPDGYTWLVSPDNVFSINPHLVRAAALRRRTAHPYVQIAIGLIV